MCHTSKRKTYNVAQSCKSSQTEKSQEKITYHNTQINNNKCLRKRYITKRNKLEKQKKYAEKRKNDHEMCHTSKRKTYNVAQSCKSSQTEKSQEKITYHNTQINNNKCLRKRYITKRNKLEKQKKYAEKRKNDHEMCHTSKRKTYNVAQSCKSTQTEKSQEKITYHNTQINNNKCLCKRDITKRNKVEKRKRYAEKRKTKDKICPTSKRKKYNLQ